MVMDSSVRPNDIAGLSLGVKLQFMQPLSTAAIGRKKGGYTEKHR